jgi:hypothetical protein
MLVFLKELWAAHPEWERKWRKTQMLCALGFPLVVILLAEVLVRVKGGK